MRRRLAIAGALRDESVPAGCVEGWRLRSPNGAGPALAVFVAHCGVGRTAVHSWLESGVAEQSWSQVIVIGFAGGLDPALAAHQVVWGTKGGRLDPSCMGRWHAAAAVSGMDTENSEDRAVDGSVWTVEEPLLNAEAKRSAWDALGRPEGAVVDMETADLVAGFEACGADLVVCRVVTDTAAEALPAVVSRVRSDGTLPAGAVMAALLGGPWGIFSLTRLGLRSRRGARRLAAAVARTWSGPCPQRL